MEGREEEKRASERERERKNVIK